MGIALAEGRAFNRFDTKESAPVVLINRTAARALFPANHRWASGCGSTMAGRIGRRDGARNRGSGRRRPSLLAGPSGDAAALRAPQAQLPSTSMVLVVQTSGPPRALSATVRQQIREINPELAAFQIATMDEVIGDSLATRRLALALVGGFRVAGAAARRRWDLRCHLALGGAAHPRDGYPGGARRAPALHRCSGC